MAFPITPSRRTRQPQEPVGINWRHPLAPWLKLAWTGQYAATSKGAALGVYETNAQRGISAAGVGVKNAGNENGGITVPHPFGLSGGAFTVMVFTDYISAVTGGSTLFSIPYSSTWSTPYAPIIFRGAGAGSNQTELFICDSGGYYEQIFGTSDAHLFVNSFPACHWVTANGSTVDFGIDRTVTSSGLTQTRVPDYSNLHNSTIFGAPPLSPSEGVTGSANSAFVFSKALSAAERVMVLDARYDLFASQQPSRLYFDLGRPKGTMRPTVWR